MIILLFFTLIVFCVNFKIALGMVAGRADLRRFLTDHKVTAVAALPYLRISILSWSMLLPVFLFSLYQNYDSVL